MPAATKTKPKRATKTTKIAVQSVTPFLWFEKDAQKAAEFYVSLLKGSRITNATPMVTEFELAGQPFMALNGGPHYELTPAFSIFVSVKTQAEVDALWDALTKDGGEESMCGWLVDKFGVSWQIIPDVLMKLIADKDPAKAKRATDAMLKMQKIDIATLKKAHAGR